MRSFLLLALVVWANVAQADILDDYAAQNSNEPFSWVVTSGDAVLTWEREKLAAGETQEVCSFNIFKNDAYTGVTFQAAPVYTNTTGTISWTDLNHVLDVDDYKIQVETCRGNHFHDGIGRNHRHNDGSLNHTHTLMIDPPTVVTPPVAQGLFANIDTAGNLDSRDTTVTPLAFPGATGPAKFASGGRGGEVFVVNSLDNDEVLNDGKLTFMEAAKGTGDGDSEIGNTGVIAPRNITFAVSGEIDTALLDASITDSNISIFCQTAPSPGVVFTGQKPIVFRHDADNIILRFCDIKTRDRLSFGNNQNVRLINFEPSTLGAPDNIMIDHVSAMWSTDDGITIFQDDNALKKVPSNITISHSIVGEGDTTCRRSDFECGSASGASSQEDYSFPNHSTAIAASSKNGTAIMKLAVVANVFPNTVARAPQLRSVVEADVRNNLIPNNYGISITLSDSNGGAMPTGWITGNTFKHGPDTTNPQNTLNTPSGASRYIINGNNQITYPAGGTGQGVISEYGTASNSTLPGNPVRLTDDGNNSILLDANDNPKCVGASVPFRDSADTRIIAEMNGLNTDPILASAEIGIGPRVPWNTELCGIDPGGSAKCFAEGLASDPPSTWVTTQGQRDYSDYVGSNTHPVGYDTDSDGIADSFENDVIALDPNDGFSSLADIDHTTMHSDGYSYFEKWTHSLAASCALSSS